MAEDPAAQPSSLQPPEPQSGRDNSFTHDDSEPSFALDEVELAELVDTVVSDPDVAGALVVAAGFAGPLPPPNLLASYEEVLPGSAERILRMAEVEQAHRHSVVDRITRTEAWLGPMGMVFGLFVSIAFLLVSAWLISDGHELAGVILGSVDLVALVTVFVVRRVRHGSG